jgi:hypothetical protein
MDYKSWKMLNSSLTYGTTLIQKVTENSEAIFGPIFKLSANCNFCILEYSGFQSRFYLVSSQFSRIVLLTLVCLRDTRCLLHTYDPYFTSLIFTIELIAVRTLDEVSRTAAFSLPEETFACYFRKWTQFMNSGKFIFLSARRLIAG